MNEVTVQPAAVAGIIAAPPSKSAAHRALICAALSGKAARVYPVATSADMEATLRVLATMGAVFTREQDAIVFTPHGWVMSPPCPLDCAESGSTLRFLLPIAAALGIEGTFVGRGRLPERPMDALTEALKKHQTTVSAARLPITLAGRMAGGDFVLPGDVSSQFISGLLLALPLLPVESTITVQGTLQSAGYVQLTLAMLADSGIAVTETADGWRISGGQQYRGGDYLVEGDYSNAAFWLCAGALGCAAEHTLTVTGLSESSPQGDRAIVPLLEGMGARICRSGDAVCVEKSGLHGCVIDAGPVPDLIPVLAMTAAFAQGETVFENAARLRLKESDRITTTTALVRALGGKAWEYPDRLVVRGIGEALTGGAVDGCNDHRIVMAAAAAAAGCTGAVTICGAHAVKKSYPNFFADYQKLRGEG